MIRLSNAEINPLTALALDLQSSKSPSLFRRFYIYPFDRDKFDFAQSLPFSLSFVRRRIIAARPKKYVPGITKKSLQSALLFLILARGTGERLFACRIKRHN